MNLQTAAQLRKNQEYQKAVDIYQSLWQQNPLQFGEWDGWSYAYSLTKLNQYTDSLEICRQLYPRFSKVEILNSVYAKSIYYTQFTQEPQPALASLRKATQAIYDLSPPHNPYSPTPKAIFKLSKVLMSQASINWAEIEGWLLKIDPDHLDDRSYTWTDSKGKNMELASPLEEWYAQMIKVKAGLNQPNELLELLSAARKKKIKWHYNNDIWFQRKEAFAYKQLGDLARAEQILKRILVKKNEWFIMFDLAQVIHDEKEKLQLLSKAAMAPGKMAMKLNVFEMMFRLLKQSEDYRHEAMLHLALFVALRQENDWPVKEDVLAQLNASNINLDELGSSVAIYQQLLPFWKQLTSATVHEGVIKKVNTDGQSGFVESNHGSFFASFRGFKGVPMAQTKVEFELVDSFDKKKNRPSKMAVNINPIVSR